MVAQNIFFYVIAAVMVAAAVAVVTNRNVVRAALALIVVFAGVAAEFILLAAEFVAVTQVLVYIGAIMVLMLFGIMLTRSRIGRDGDMTNEHWWVGVLTSLLLVGVMGYALIDYFGDDPLPAERQITAVDGSNTATVSDAIFSQYLIPFEVISVLLLAALVGAIVIALEGPVTQMDDLLVNQFLLLGAILFCIGVYGVIARKNTVLVLMSIELILNAVNINLLTFGALQGNITGSVFALFIIAVAAAEVGVGLAMVLIIYRNRSSVDLDDIDAMRG